MKGQAFFFSFFYVHMLAQMWETSEKTLRTCKVWFFPGYSRTHALKLAGQHLYPLSHLSSSQLFFNKFYSISWFQKARKDDYVQLLDSKPHRTVGHQFSLTAPAYIIFCAKKSRTWLLPSLKRKHCLQREGPSHHWPQKLKIHPSKKKKKQIYNIKKKRLL